MPEIPVYGAEQAPKYFVTNFGDVSSVGGNCVSFECALLKGDHLEVQFTVIIPAECIGPLARRAMVAAAEMHNDLRLMPSH